MGRPEQGKVSSQAKRLAEAEAQVKRLERHLDRDREALHDANLKLQGQIVELQARSAELKSAQAELARMRRRRSVRAALAVAAGARWLLAGAKAVVRAPLRARHYARHWRGQRAASRRLRATPGAERALITRIRAALPLSTVSRGPLVSIIILNRDGRAHLERCLRAIASTAYREVEIVVVDNGSTDGSAELAERMAMPFPLKVIRNADNRSFSEANGQGVAAAAGDLICFLNNDVDPITDDWLGYLVETMGTPGAVAVGARLIYPRHRGGRRAGERFPDLTLQHRGVAFDRTIPVPMPRPMGAGDDPMSSAAVAVVERPALTAACLLVSRAAYEAVGGFATEYDYGLEDVDLCLKLRAAGGRLIYDGRAALWHHESATRIVDPELRRARVERNREAYVDAWGPRIFRETLLDAVAGGTSWSEEPLAIGLTVDSHDVSAGGGDTDRAHQLSEALGGLGWCVSDIDMDAPDLAGARLEVLIVRHPTFDLSQSPSNLLTIALIEGAEDEWASKPWFNDFDLVVAHEGIADRIMAASAKRPVVLEEGSRSDVRVLAHGLRDSLAGWASATRYGLRIGVPNREVAEQWGDYHFARGLQRALERDGYPTRVHLVPAWQQPVSARDDVSIHLFGLRRGPTRRGQVNLLWHISHPDRADTELYELYDHVFVASDAFARRMARRTRVTVEPLHQATDPERFRPDPSGPHHELLFVGNTRNVRRRIIDDLAGTAHDLAIYGRGWSPQLVDPRFVRGEYVDNAELSHYYASASIVLNDHWDDMRTESFLSNRLYDALASGAFVISDEVEGIDTEFAGAVVTYGERDELEALVERYLADPGERRRLAEIGRSIVLERHTFERRAATVQDAASRLLAAHPPRILAVERRERR